MAKRRTGLHKEISSIFGGVSIPQNNGTQQRLRTPTPNRIRCAPLEPQGPNPQIPVEPKYKQVAQSPAKPTAKAAPVRQSNVGVTVKTAGQMPWQQTWRQIKDKFFASKAGVSTTRQKVMVILVPVLFIVMIVMFTQVLSAPSHKATGPASFGPTKTFAGSTNKVDWQIPTPYPTTLRDPMRFGPVKVTQDGTNKLIVKGIVSSKDNSSAIIDNQIVHEGEEISGATVVKINKDSVEFEMKGKSWKQRVQR